MNGPSSPAASRATLAPGPSVANLREPQPDVQRGQQEEEREGVRGDDEQCDDAEREHRGGVAGEFLLDRRGLARSEPAARDEPAGDSQDEQQDQAERRPVAGRSRLGVDRVRRAAGPDADEAEEEEHRPDPQPEAEPAAVRAQRGRDGDLPPPAAREQVDRDDDERQQHRHQCELDCPSSDEPAAEKDVAVRAAGELEPFVERAEQRLRGAADVRHLLPVQALRRVPERRRWAVTAGRDRDRRNPAADERRLLVEAEREAQIGQLSERARPARRPSRSAR